jgi:peroxiredoxin
LRQDYQAFLSRNAEIIAIGPDGPRAFRRYWDEEHLPFHGCADPKHRVADVYGQEVNWLKFGRLPAIFIVDKAGQIRYRYFGESMSDIPTNVDVLAMLDELSAEG